MSPFLDDSVEETTANILKCDFSFPDEYFHEISNDAKNLLKRLLVFQGSARATMTECQSCPWFMQVKYAKQYFNRRILSALLFYNKNVRYICFCFIYYTGTFNQTNLYRKIGQL